MAHALAALALVLSPPLVQCLPNPMPAPPTYQGITTIPDAQNFSGPSDQYANAPSSATAPQPATGILAATTINALSFMEPEVESFTYAEPMLFEDANGNPHAVARDLGYSGAFDGKVIWTWGDTLVNMNGDDFTPTAVDSSTVTYDLRYPFLTKDTSMNDTSVNSLVPLNQDETSGGGYNHYAFGGTNIIQTTPGYGLMYYLVNHRALGDLNGGSNEILGAGAAEVTLDDQDRPVLRRFGNTLWTPQEPTWGATGIALNQQDQYIYIFGGGPPNADDDLVHRTFLCRVPLGHAADIDSYEYFDNSTTTWGKQRFGDGNNGTIETRADMAVFGYREMNQAAPFWSNYYNRWLYVHGSGYSSTPVLLKSAHQLQGPWIDHGEVAPTKPDVDEGNNMRYAVMGHPEFDDSGKTVVVTWTRANRIWGGILEFADRM